MQIHPGLCATVFFAGVVSFFSPCVLPLLPVYLGYFSADGQADRASIGRRLTRTGAFVAGISVVFVLMGIGAGLAGGILQNRLFVLLCGVGVVLLGLHQTGWIQIPLLERTRMVSSPVAPGKGMLGAFFLGFCFSFGWTPCVGPILATVLGVSLKQGDALAGGILLLIYVAGFSIPFMLLAAGSHLLLEKIRCLYPHLGKIKLAGGLLVMAMGIWMIAGQVPAQQMEQPQAKSNLVSSESVSPSDWAGKIVYLKFWATWCPVCLSGMQEFSELAEEYAGRDDVVIYSVVAPGYHNEMDAETFSKWAAGQELTFPILFDEGGELNRQYGISGYPSSVFLNGSQEVAAMQIGHMRNEEVEKQIADLIQEEGVSK